MAEFDITVVVTAHNETLVTGPTMQAAEISIAYAEANGFSVERVIALDKATDDCRACMTQPAYDDWTKIELQEGDLGRTRNAIVSELKGRFIAFLDSDDLFSENWLAEAAEVLIEAEKASERVIVHPELNWFFDGGSMVRAKPGQDDPLFVPEFFALSNYYDSMCMAPREAHLEFPYVSRDIPNGLSFQDWQFNIETIAGGWKHRIARDTIIFKRRRDSSLVTESRDRKSIVRHIPPMAIDRIRDLGKPGATQKDAE